MSPGPGQPVMTTCSADGETTADDERFAGHVGAVAEFPDPVGDLLRLCGPAQRDGLDRLLDAASGAGAGGIDPAGGDRVDGDVVVAQFDRERAGQLDDRGL